MHASSRRRRSSLSSSGSAVTTPITGDPVFPRRGSIAGHRSIDDAAQLLFAAERGRCLVSRNARDFHRLSIEFQQQELQHAGGLLVPPSFRGNEFMAIAAALAEYADQYPDGVPAYFVDYLRRTRI